jgi:hypothetical protein
MLSRISVPRRSCVGGVHGGLTVTNWQHAGQRHALRAEEVAIEIEKKPLE